MLSHSDLPHLGAYPYARSHLGMTCPVYSTIPIVNMGRICLYDLYQAKTDELDFKTFSLEDVDNAFDKITSLRYSQPTALTGNFIFFESYQQLKHSHLVIKEIVKVLPLQLMQLLTLLVVPFGKLNKTPMRLSML